MIDVADLRKRRFGALTLKQRIRNFRHMLRYPEDRAALKNFGVERTLRRLSGICFQIRHPENQDTIIALVAERPDHWRLRERFWHDILAFYHHRQIVIGPHISVEAQVR
ncbi:MAG TPA: hypothetical protein VIQ01_01665, partial [Burkholderiales bacterium]